MLNRGLAMLIVASGLVLASPALAEAPSEDIDLRLFPSSEIAGNRGCSVLLWQSDRDPAKDKFAYLFNESLLGQNHVRHSTRIKIGGDVKSLKRVATGGITTGFGVFEYQLYQLPEPNEFVVLELQLADKKLGSVEIGAGKLTVILEGKPIFRVAVKGKAGCMPPDAAVPPAKDNPATGVSRSASSIGQRTAVAACLEAAKSTDIPTSFECDWKQVVQTSGGATFSGEYKLRAKGADGVLTILEPHDGPAYVGIQTVRQSTTAVCDVSLGAVREEKKELVAKLDDPEACEVRLSKIAGSKSVKVTTTNQCNPHLCGNGSSFDGQWVPTTK